MLKSREIWANLIEVNGSYFLTLNESILGEDLMLTSFQKNEDEGLGEFLKRVRSESEERLKIRLNSLFFGFWSKQKNLSFLRDFDLERELRRGRQFEEIVNQFLDHSSLKLSAYFRLRECLVKHKTNLNKRRGVVLINSSKKMLEIADLNGRERRKISFDWEKFLREIAPGELTKREFDLLLRGGFNLADLEASLLNPNLNMRPFYLKLNQFLAKKLTELGLLTLRGRGCVIMTGFLTTFKGIKTFLKIEFDLDLITSIDTGANSIRELNETLNRAIKDERIQKSNTSNTGEYAINLKRTRWMLEWFYNFFGRRQIDLQRTDSR